MQSGSLQVHADNESGQQYIALPLSLMQGNGGSGLTMTSNGAAGGSSSTTISLTATRVSGSGRGRGSLTSNGTSNGADAIMKEINVKTEMNND